MIMKLGNLCMVSSVEAKVYQTLIESELIFETSKRVLLNFANGQIMR